MASVFDVYGGYIISTAAILIALTVCVVVVRALRAAPYRGLDRICYVAALTGALIASAAPHIQYYDLALLAFGAVFIVRRADAAPPEARARHYGVLVLLALWLEMAGMFAGAGLSISFVPLLLFTAMLAWWPRVESWLCADAMQMSGASVVFESQELRAA